MKQHFTIKQTKSTELPVTLTCEGVLENPSILQILSISIKDIKEDISQVFKTAFTVLHENDKLSDKNLSNRIYFSLLLCNDVIIQHLNHMHMNNNEPTDVLAFPTYENFHIGDIAISLETTYRDSQQSNTNFSVLFKKYLIHGILHLLGYDHERSKEDEIIMNGLENQIFRRL